MKNTAQFLVAIVIFLFGSFESSAQLEHAQFDVPFLDTLYLPSEHCMIYEVTLYQVNRNKTKEFYQSNTIGATDSVVVPDKKTVVIRQIDSMVIIRVPPLEPNRIYSIQYKFYTENNIYGVFQRIHSEQIEMYEEDAAWMKVLQNLNQTGIFKVLYMPFISEIEDFKKALADINPDTDSLKLMEAYFRYFEPLNFRKDKLYHDGLVEYAKYIKNATAINHEHSSSFHKYIAKIPDYLRIYQFYNQYLRLEMGNPTLGTSDYITLVNNSLSTAHTAMITACMASGDAVPNFYQSFQDLNTITISTLASTHAKNFETGYKRMIVPDFGYIGYIPTKSDFTLTGGSPYVGAHIHIKPVNKQVPLRLSEVGVLQRTSLHFGVTLNSVAKSGSIENFLNDNSLTVGVGYIVFSHALRFNAGTALYRKIDPITANRTVGLTPYVGVSIDIEIRKWLDTTVPSLAGLFKKD